QIWRKEEQAFSALQTKKLQTEGQLGVLTAERNAAASQAEREAQATRETLDLGENAPLPALTTVQRQLEYLAQKQEQHAVLLRREELLHQEREQAERRAVELRAELQARDRALAETQQSVMQAENILAEARAVLQTALQESGLLDLGSEGEKLRERLDT